MKPMPRRSGCAAVALMAATTAACSSLNREPPDVYSTMSAEYIAAHAGKIVDHATVSSGDAVKRSFVKFMFARCTGPIPAALSDTQAAAACLALPPADPTSYQCWARKNPASVRCLNSVMTYAMDQCVAKVGTQNTFAAKTNLYLGFFLAAAGLATDAAVIANSSNASAGLVAAAVATGATNLQKLVPITASTSLQNVVMAGQSYASVAGLGDTTLGCLQSDRDPDCKKQVLLQYSRLHDAVYSGCPAGAY